MVFPAHIFLKTLTVYIYHWLHSCLKQHLSEKAHASFTNSNGFKDAALVYTTRLNTARGAGQVTWSGQDSLHSLPISSAFGWSYVWSHFAKPAALGSHLSRLGWRALCSSAWDVVPSCDSAALLPYWHGLREEFALLPPDPQLEKPTSVPEPWGFCKTRAMHAWGRECMRTERHRSTTRPHFHSYPPRTRKVLPQQVINSINLSQTVLALAFSLNWEQGKLPWD